MTIHRYNLFGVVVESSAELALQPAEDGDGAEVWTFEFGDVEQPEGRLVHDVADFDGRRRLKVWVDEDDVWFSHGTTRAKWSGDSRRIRMHTGDDLRTRPGIVLERVVAPISLMVRRPNRVAMHASAVGDGERAWIFAGDSGAGKSTTALELMRRGLEILADDLILVDADSKRLMAAMPSVRLFDQPDRVPEAIEGELVLPEYEKYWYRLPPRRIADRPVPIAAVFSLEPDEEAGAPSCEEVSGREATVRILGQSFDLTEADGDWRANRFRRLCDVARSVPVFRVTYRRSDRDAPAQLDAIEETLRSRWSVELTNRRLMAGGGHG